MPNHSIVRLLAAASFGALVGLPSLAQNVTTYSGLFVVGDSLSDGGNINLSLGGLVGPNPTNATYIPSLPYAPSGAFTNLPDFSNGPSWVGAFAANLGLVNFSAPSVLGGGNYAYGGARMFTDGVTQPPLPPNFPPSVQSQLTSLITTGPAVSPTALYVIEGGGNDVRDVGAAVAGGAPLLPTTLAAAGAYASAAAQMVGTLKAAGATHIIVWNVPDVGKTPSAGAGVGPVADAASFIAGAFNSALSTALTGSGVTVFDSYALIDGWVADPAGFGFTNVTQACGFAGNACDPGHALFWDGIHPTAYAQGLLASAMVATAVSVPEPASVLMLSAGLLLVLARWRCRVA